MNRYVTALIVGMVALVVGAQGTIRLLVDHDNAGVLAWLPGGFTARLVGYLLLVVVGIAVAGWADARRRRRGTA